MLVIRDAWERRDLPRGGIATVGNYDGIHRGQRAVLDRVVERARVTGRPALVITFEPHPRSLLRPGEPLLALTTPEQKEALLAACGVDALVSLSFDRELAAVPAEEFVRRFLVEAAAVEELYVGSRFAFGHRRRGDLALLEALAAEGGFTAEGVPEVLYDGEPVSSTRIRKALAAGRVGVAREMLGRPYAIAGTVVHGDGRGRGLGWPTANLDPDNEILPADGVYAAGLALEGGSPLPGVANLGVRPTVTTAGPRTAEVHVLDFDGDLYGRRAEILFCRRLRSERRFPSLDELRLQIERDAAAAREYFAGYSCWTERVPAEERLPGPAERHEEVRFNGK